MHLQAAALVLLQFAVMMYVSSAATLGEMGHVVGPGDPVWPTSCAAPTVADSDFNRSDFRVWAGSLWRNGTDNDEPYYQGCADQLVRAAKLCNISDQLSMKEGCCIQGCHESTLDPLYWRCSNYNLAKYFCTTLSPLGVNYSSVMLRTIIRCSGREGLTCYNVSAWAKTGLWHLTRFVRWLVAALDTALRVAVSHDSALFMMRHHWHFADKPCTC